MRNTQTSFEKLFRAFIDAQPDCEVYERADHHGTGGYADFLVFEQSIVAELKCLDKDFTEKVQAIADRRLNERHRVFIGGPRPFDTLFKGDADFEAVNWESLTAIKERFRKDLHVANEQIRDTKRRKALAASYGLIIVANITNAAMDPEIVRWIVAQDLRHGRYGDTDAVLYLPILAEQHIAVDSHTRLVRCEVFYRTNGMDDLHSKISILLARWSAHIGHGFAGDL